MGKTKTRTHDEDTRTALAAKEAEAKRLQANAKPLALVLMVVALVTMLSALAGTSIGLPAGLHMITAPVLIVLVLIRLPANLRRGALMKEIEELKAKKGE